VQDFLFGFFIFVSRQERLPMQAFTQALIQSMARHWRPLLMLALIPALQNCSRIDGSVELNNGNGEPYSFEGAKVEIFDLHRASRQHQNPQRFRQRCGR